MIRNFMSLVFSCVLVLFVLGCDEKDQFEVNIRDANITIVEQGEHLDIWVMVPKQILDCDDACEDYVSDVLEEALAMFIDSDCEHMTFSSAGIEAVSEEAKGKMVILRYRMPRNELRVLP